jgi:hypothetical protein
MFDDARVYSLGKLCLSRERIRAKNRVTVLINPRTTQNVADIRKIIKGVMEENDQRTGKPVTCYGCGVKRHKENQCRNPDEWDNKHNPKKNESAVNSSNMAQGKSTPASGSSSNSILDRDAFVFNTISSSVSNCDDSYLESSDPFERVSVQSDEASPVLSDSVSLDHDAVVNSEPTPAIPGGIATPSLSLSSTRLQSMVDTAPR